MSKFSFIYIQKYCALIFKLQNFLKVWKFFQWHTKSPKIGPFHPRLPYIFQDLGAAYEVLSDEEKRKLYDKCGEECVQKGGGNDAFDPFQSFFGDFGFGFDFGGDGQRGGEREIPRGADIVMTLWVTLEELYVGNFVEVRFSFKA